MIFVDCNHDARTFRQRVMDARTVARLAMPKVTLTTETGKVRRVLVPGHQMRQYEVWLHMEGSIATAKCYCQEPKEACGGNLVVPCWHAICALFIVAWEADFEVVFPEDEDTGMYLVSGQNRKQDKPGLAFRYRKGAPSTRR